MTTSNQDPTHRRSATRAPVGRPIKLQFDDSMDVIEGLCRNVSIGGMFIVFESSRPAGSLVRFELDLEDDNAIRGLGEVVWMRSKSEFKGPEAGFGLKFRFLEQRDRQMIFKLVSRHIKDRLANREPAGGEPEPELAAPAAARLRASIAVPPDPEPPATPVELPAALTALPESELLSLEPEAPPPATPPGPPAAEVPATAAGAQLEAPAAAPPEDSFDFGLEPEPAPEPGEALERSAEGFPGDEMDDDLTLSDFALPDTEAATLEPGDLGPSVGDTPFYELGLDPEPASARPPRPEAPFETPAPSAPTLPAGLHLAEGPATAADGGSYAQSAAETPRRQFGVLPALGVLLVTAAAVGYLFKDALLGRFGGEPRPATESAAGTAAPPASSGGVKPVDEEGASPGAAPEAEATSATQTAVAPPEQAPPPPEEAEPSPPPTVQPSAAPSPVTEPSPATAGAEASGEFTRLLDISWDEVGGGLRVTLTADGTIPNGRYRYFHLGGDAPREVVKLMGVSQSFGKSQLSVGGPGVRRIRTGFHQVKGVQQQHVVIDLLGPRWQITEVTSVGSRLELTIAEP